ncbi:hypothetical protein H0H93_007586 [Arthromyces matolae]|nr:hypothetical protein H0H93_007586 [Arthromyces matolae]
MARETSGSGSKPSAEATNGVRVKSEKDKGKRKAAAVEDEDENENVNANSDGQPDEEEDQDDEAEDDESAGSSRGIKRARVNDDGDSRPADIKKAERAKTLPRDTDGYIPGSIVRIRLENFVTYDSVEFSVGPYLNMILGPNGTGKSSIACAICIGLNFPPSVLGRATELNSFVKIGKDEGFIEIELKGKKGQGNLVIRRHLSATSKTTRFEINGTRVSGKEITAKMAELNVQVGNLCSFLPQDKVSEFAQMSPQELLRETQRAAGDERLTSWHDTLINAGKELRVLLQNIQDESNQVRQMQERNELLERDVQRYKDRKSIEETIALLQLLIPVERYRQLRRQFLEVKSRQRKLHEKVRKLKAKNEPAHALLKYRLPVFFFLSRPDLLSRKLETDHKEYEKTRDDFKKTAQAKFNKMKTKWVASEKLETEAEELTSKLDLLKAQEKERLRKIANAEAEIERTRDHLLKLNETKLENMDDVVADGRKVLAEREEVMIRKSEAEDKIKINIDEKTRSNVQLNHAQQELQRLDDINNIKMQNLQRWDKDCLAAVLWLRKNRNLFKMEVIEPAVLTLTVPNRPFANAVEANISGIQFRTFICQCKEDSDTFNKQINDDGVLGKDVRVAVWFRSPSRLQPPPMTREEMAQIGFDGYLLDYVDCPEGMRWWLQRELNFHRTAVSIRGVDVTQAMELVARPETGGGASFISRTTMNNVSRSAYGQRNVSNISREIKAARTLGNVTVDPEVKRRIEGQISSFKQELANHDIERQELEDRLKAVLDEDKVFGQRLEACRKRRDKIKEVTNNRVKVQSKLERNEADLKKLRDQPSAESKRASTKQRLYDITQKRIQIAKEYTALARSMIEEQTEATRMGIRFLQIGANKAALQDLCNRKDEKYNKALIEFNQVDEEFRDIKSRSKNALEESRVLMQNCEEEVRVTYNKIEAKRTEYDNALKAAEENGSTPPSAEDVDVRTVDELQEELEKQQAQLELNMNTNAGVVEQYEKRKRDIEVLEKTIEAKQRSAEKIERQIKSARDNWQPALEKLVASIGEKFSAAFDRIGCAGEVRISQHEDFEKWAIDILVKFRDTEKLQLLTGQRQSGGERSLTTILYLLSLTEEARAPFSLVDEINQGMDQRAERSVHNSMVQVTCKPDSAQYFLITPKLLPDLMYHERMKILCVNNGEWLPEEHHLGNMMNMINGYLDCKRNSKPSAAAI